MRAIKLTEPLKVDGKLDEEVYSAAAVRRLHPGRADATAQSRPRRPTSGSCTTQNNIYVSRRCWDSAPPDKWIANELRRDTNQLRQNDHFGVMFDTFYDRRSGFVFYTNPLGALADYSVVDEGGSNTDWNPVWDVEDRPVRGRLDGRDGDPAQVAPLPVRQRPGLGYSAAPLDSSQERVDVSDPVPQNLAGPQALNRISVGGTLVGLDLPPASRNLELKPYAISRVDDRSRCACRPSRNDFDRDIGGDVKYGVTANLTADFTVNTDFAQVEIDEQQVNLTRFSLFFPEKRDFFLEGRGVFDFARGGAGARAAAQCGSEARPTRPICSTAAASGSIANRVIPINAGGRLTGKVGPFGVGVMNIQTGDEEVVGARADTNFTVVRVKRDILRRSTIGAMFTNRSVDGRRPGRIRPTASTRAFSFYQNLSLGAYWARTDIARRDAVTMTAIRRSSTTPPIATARASSS